jgi:hypothetical protein
VVTACGGSRRRRPLDGSGHPCFQLCDRGMRRTQQEPRRQALWVHQRVYFSIIQRKALSPNDFTTSTWSSNASPASRSATTQRPDPSSGSSPPPTWPISWTDSTDTNKPRPPTPPNPRPPDPRRTYKPDHLDCLAAAHSLRPSLRTLPIGALPPTPAGSRPPGELNRAVPAMPSCLPPPLA